jgi:polyribonucleotide nucleotidyltransferase
MLKGIRHAYVSFEPALQEFASNKPAADRHARSLHKAIVASAAGIPADLVPEEKTPVNEEEQAIRNEVDVELNDLSSTPSIAATLIANSVSSSSSWSAGDTSNSSINTEPVSTAVSMQEDTWTFEIGRLAKLADGACSVRSGSTTVLTTVASAPGFFFNRRDLRSIPFIVDYREKLYAVGRIPGTYNKREGAPKEHEMLAARRLERALRPLLPRGYSYATQITASVLSADGSADPEVLAINAASAALAVSDIPWGGPLGAARVAWVNEKLVINPKPSDINDDQAELSLLVAATEESIVMLEASGRIVSEEKFIEALRAGVDAARQLLPAQKALQKARNKGKRVAELAGADPAAGRRVSEEAREAADSILRSSDLGCASRTQALIAAKAAIIETMRAAGCWRAEFARVPGSGCVTNSDVEHAFSAVLGSTMRSLVIQEGLRPDGRGPIDLRRVKIEADHVPVVHGSSVIDAGDTQALCTATVGNISEMQRIESLLGGDDGKRLFVHYSLPDFALVEGVARSGMSGGPLLRHEMDRSSFIERALLPVLPSEDKFPFSVRVNAEALAADGGSGTVAVCGSAVAMTDAGVPLSSLVAAVSVGLMSEGGTWNGEPEKWLQDEQRPPLGQYELITDPTGLEISQGDMELRVAGTAGGITACQLDVQIPGGVPLEVIEEALKRAKVARIRVLGTMEEALPNYSHSVGHPKIGDTTATAAAGTDKNAAKYGTLRIPMTSIGAVIGKEGSVLRGIEAVNGAKVNIGDGGVLTIFAPSTAQFESARAALRAAAGDTLEPGTVYTGKVVGLKDFGAFIQIPGCDMRALLHISEMAQQRIRAVEDVVKVGDLVKVVFLGRDHRGMLKVSRKAALTMNMDSSSSLEEGKEDGGL